jgi:pimeloyl-ACP methyl ester carboxylesterase
LWADQLVYGQWRVQRNTVTGRSRLLDGDNRRHASGSFEDCRMRLIEISRERDLPTLRPRVVLVLHGLGRSRSSMGSLCRYLRQNPDWTVMTFGYPSTQGSIADHAHSLGQVVENFDGVTEVNLVAHSLGNLVARRWMHDVARRDNDTREWRLGRFVMLGPPNHQPQLARLLTPLDKDGLVAGEAVRELGVGWPEIADTLATPECAFGIIAGGTGDGGFNPLIAGDDDAVVGVETARLAGADDFRLVRVEHTFIMDDTRVQQLTRRFLETGCFETAEAAQPIEAQASE